MDPSLRGSRYFSQLRSALKWHLKRMKATVCAHQMPVSTINSMTVGETDNLMSNSHLICFIGLHMRSMP